MTYSGVNSMISTTDTIVGRSRSSYVANDGTMDQLV